MPEIRRTARVDASPDRVYDVVADLERYPELLDSCRRIEVGPQDGDELLATLTLDLGPVSGEHRAHFRFDRPRSVHMGFTPNKLFARLEAHWEFAGCDPDGCDLSLHVDYEFTGITAQVLLSPFLGMACTTLINGAAAAATRDAQ
jgi:coenzyme Q-binding protein COQ10